MLPLIPRPHTAASTAKAAANAIALADAVVNYNTYKLFTRLLALIYYNW
ncbi:hypothetical protein [Nostoc sp.]